MITCAAPPVFVTFTQTGAALALKLAASFPGAEVHGLYGRTGTVDVYFKSTADHLRELFVAGRPVVGICAAGILIRLLAPVILDKQTEPPVVALGEDGSVAVPLIGGHRGANKLAQALAYEIGGVAAITTAGDLVFGIALDEPPAGWRIADPSRVKAVAAALLAGEPVSLKVEAADAAWLTDRGLVFSRGDVGILITDRTPADGDQRLVFHPPVLAIGIGCERGTTSGEIIELITETLDDAGLAANSVSCIVSLDLKANEDGVHAAAECLGVPARFFSAGTLEGETSRLANPSEVVFAEVGCHGVAEGAALAAVGATGDLVVTKRKSKRATCAIGRAQAALMARDIGRKRGSLTIVGIGPGRDGWRTPAVTRALISADEVVGYKLYLELVKHLIVGKPRHYSVLSEEDKRVRMALDIAATGREVVLVCSGDAGIYALASLAFELIDREDRADWNRMEINVEPGISAIQAAAARIGAPIGHDFCTISLSDLLTPWDDIMRRLKAAADGDFVVALYNPVSRRRQIQLTEAQRILVQARARDTPVVLARNLGREGEKVDITTLAELTPDCADMLTLVLIGNSKTKIIERGGKHWVYTPRGYSNKLQGTT